MRKNSSSRSFGRSTSMSMCSLPVVAGTGSVCGKIAPCRRYQLYSSQNTRFAACSSSRAYSRARSESSRGVLGHASSSMKTPRSRSALRRASRSSISACSVSQMGRQSRASSALSRTPMVVVPWWIACSRKCVAPCSPKCSCRAPTRYQSDAATRGTR